MNANEYGFSSSSSFDNLPKLDAKSAEIIDDNIIQARNETINNLRSQLNDMMEKLKEMDNITAENQQLRQEKLELESKYNSLNDRFQICLKINENNKKDLQKLTKEKEDFEIKMKQYEMSRANFEQKANQEKKELEEALERSNTNSNSNDYYKKQIAQLNDNISLLLSASSQVFNQNFPTLESLRSFIVNFNEDSVIMPKDKRFSASNSVMSAPQDEDYLQVINKLKQKNHKKKILQKSLQNEISSLKSDLQKHRKQSDAIITDLQNKYNDELTDEKVKQMNLQSKIADLEKENQRLQDKLKKKSDQVAAMNSVTPAVTAIDPNDITNEVDLLKQNVDNLQEELKNSKKKNTKLKKQIASLVDELKRDEECQNQLKNQIETLASQNEEASEASSNQAKLNERLIQENELLKKQNQHLTEEKDSANQNYKKLKNEANAIQNDLSQAKITISDLEALVSQYKNENSDLVAAKNSISEALNKQNKELAQKGEKVMKAEEELKVLQFKLKTLENSMKIEEQQIVQIPKVTWFCSELPRDLCSEIIGIGKKENLPLQDKLKNVLSITATYIKNIIDENQKNQLKYDKEKSKLNDILKRIVTLVNNQVGEPKIQIPMDQLIIDNIAYENGNKIFDLIESRFAELQDIQMASEEEKKKLEEYLTRLIDVIGAESYDAALDKIYNIQNFINAYDAKTKSLHVQNKEIKSDYNDLLDQYKSLKNKVSQVLASKDEKIEQLKNELAAISKDRDLSKKKIDELQNEIQRVNEEQQETLSTIEFEQQQRSAELCQTLQRDYSAKLLQKENEVESLKQNIQKLTQKIARLKKKNETLAKKAQSLEAELSSIEDGKNEIRKEEKQKYKEELKNTVAQLNAIIENDKIEIEGKNQEIEKYTNKVSKAKTAFISLKEKCLKLEKENKISKAQLEASKIENERLKNFCDAKIKASATLNENNYKIELGKINAEKESRIQELYHFVVETFSNFYDPREQLDSSSVKNILIAVRNKLESYTSQDAVIRQTLNVSSNEDVEEMIRSLVPTKL